MRAAQPGDGYIPKHPTDGWAFHELRALGIKGDIQKAEEMLKALRDRGYDVSKKPSVAREQDGR
jgi:hypothetical protein